MPNMPRSFRLAETATKFAPQGRDPSYRHKYMTRRWINYTKRFRVEHPFCVKCGQPSRHVDHIDPVEDENEPRFWDPNNHQAMCHSCHSRKTATQDGGFGNRKKRRG